MTLVFDRYDLYEFTPRIRSFTYIPVSVQDVLSVQAVCIQTKMIRAHSLNHHSALTITQY